MWKVAGDAARSTARFVRRHRRAIVVGGVVGAAACAYYRMKRALEEVRERNYGATYSSCLDLECRVHLIMREDGSCCSLFMVWRML